MCGYRRFLERVLSFFENRWQILCTQGDGQTQHHRKWQRGHSFQLKETYGIVGSSSNCQNVVCFRKQTFCCPWT